MQNQFQGPQGVLLEQDLPLGPQIHTEDDCTHFKAGREDSPKKHLGPSMYKSAVVQWLYSGIQWHPVELKILIIVKKKKEYLSSE